MSTESKSRAILRSPGERAALDYVFTLAYEELRRLTATLHRTNPDAAPNPSSLVQEAWTKLAASPQVAATAPLHFKRIAAQAMRQLLIEAARRRMAQRHERLASVLVSIEDSIDEVPAGDDVLLALDAALCELAVLNPRQAAIIEMRLFGGLEIKDAAEILDVAEATIRSELRRARAWLSSEPRPCLPS